jgi:hypothetical protein
MWVGIKFKLTKFIVQQLSGHTAQIEKIIETFFWYIFNLNMYRYTVEMVKIDNFNRFIINIY